MRGRVDDQSPPFHAFGVEGHIRPDHPVRGIKRRFDRILVGISAAVDPLGHARDENRHGLIGALAVGEACGTAERDAAACMLDEVAATHDLRPTGGERTGSTTAVSACWPSRGGGSSPTSR
jgi:hypothetical protein